MTRVPENVNDDGTISWREPRLWGKLRKNREGKVEDWLPLIDHCTDVASVFRALCQQPAIARSLAGAAGRTLSAVDVDRLAVLAFLHDIGKCNHGFQAKAQARSTRTAGHVRELAALFYDPELASRFAASIRYPELALWFEGENEAESMLLASVSHHGKPVELDDIDIHQQKPLWTAANGIDPLVDIAALQQCAQETFPQAFVKSELPLAATPALQHRFAGLVMLADWLGSHAEGFFPFHHGDGPRAAFAATAAHRAVAAVGLDPTAARAGLNTEMPFTALFPFSPSPLQKALFESTDSPIVIAESDTGSGKTEAALGYFFRLFARGDVDALYFALPTRVAARELYERILSFARCAFGENHPPVVLAVPGYARVDGELLDQSLPTPAHLWQDDAHLRHLERAWAAERPKRFLAAPIAVGTVDQALLSVMQVNHAHLRAACLDRALLVVDEVHASDTYMRGLLRALLDHHRAAGGRALLLSATLSGDARTELLTPLSQAHKTPSLEAALALPYPALTDADNKTRPISGTSRTDKCVEVEPLPCLSSPERILPGLIDAVAAGGRVLVVLNTVSRVIALFKAAEGQPTLRDALFRVNGIACPHHGRFARADRLLLDQAAGSRLGKAGPEGPLLLIGSQTLEQSLDIDADWLVTDLCPMDVLLQRIGRLHRHVRARPEGFEKARCAVLVPEDRTLASFFDASGRVRGEAGIGKVYPDLRIVRLTLDCLGEGCELHLPAENRGLVEATTHPARLQAFAEGPWIRHRNELLAVATAHGQASHSALLQETLVFGDPDLRFGALGEKLSTRLGLEDRRIPLDRPLASPFGQILREFAIPGWMAQGLDATALDSAPTTEHGLLRFRYGGKAYRYTRLGLEFDNER